MKSYLFFVVFIIYTFFIIGNIEAKTIHIPADYPTIQEGIDSAGPGDMVLVAKGTYSGGINMKGGIYLKSEEGPESTIISGGKSVISCISLTDTALIDGFTIRDCNTENRYGGGIYSYNSNIIIRNNIIRNNTVTAYMLSAAGGGIYVGGGSALVENNIITGNDAMSDVFPKNKKKSSIMLVKDGGNNLQGKYSFYGEGGGGIYAESAMVVTIKNNVIGGNSASYGGFSGGGIKCTGCIKAVVFNNLIDRSWTENGKYLQGYGMGIYCTAPVEIINNTIVNNYDPLLDMLDSTDFVQGGGIYCEKDSLEQDSIIIKDNIIAFDSASIGGGIYCDSLGISKVLIGYNDFYLNAPDNFYNAPQGTGNFSWGTNRNGISCDSFYNINIDPGFTTGPSGNYYQQNVSGCGDYIVGDEFGFIGGNTPDGKPDTGWVDLGYHYGLTIGVEEKKNKQNAECLMLNAYPNPFVNTTGIRVQGLGISKEEKINLRIYDIAGKLIEIHPITQLPNNSITKITIGEKLKAGVYFVKVNGYKPIKIIKMREMR